MVGRPVLRFEEKGKDGQLKDIMVGDDASENRTMLQITYPVDKGKPHPLLRIHEDGNFRCTCASCRPLTPLFESLEKG